MRRSECALCFVADQAFLYPSAASALSFRRFASCSDTDILIFLWGSFDVDLQALSHHLSLSRISLVQLESPDAAVTSLEAWTHTHLTPATLGRFMIADQLRDAYHRFIYLDGDTLFDSDPQELVSFDPGDDRIGAVEDIRSFARSDLGRFGASTRAYFAGLGLKEDQPYFNCGLLVSRSETWLRMARECLTFFSEHASRCLIFDQSAMNAVLNERRISLPIGWNYQTPFKMMGVDCGEATMIRHFTESTKPWLGPLYPWAEQHVVYQRLECELGELLSRPSLSQARIAEENARTAARMAKMRTLFAVRCWIKTVKIKDYDRDARRALQERSRAQQAWPKRRAEP